MNTLGLFAAAFLANLTLSEGVKCYKYCSSCGYSEYEILCEIACYTEQKVRDRTVYINKGCSRETKEKCTYVERSGYDDITCICQSDLCNTGRTIPHSFPDISDDYFSSPDVDNAHDYSPESNSSHHFSPDVISTHDSSPDVNSTHHFSPDVISIHDFWQDFNSSHHFNPDINNEGVKCYSKHGNSENDILCDVACYTEYIRRGTEAIAIEKGCSSETKEKCTNGEGMVLNYTKCTCQTDFCNSGTITAHSSPDVNSTDHINSEVNSTHDSNPAVNSDQHFSPDNKGKAVKCYKCNECDNFQYEKLCDVACYTHYIQVENETFIVEKGCSWETEEKCTYDDTYFWTPINCTCQTDLCNSGHDIPHFNTDVNNTHDSSPDVISTHQFSPDKRIKCYSNSRNSEYVLCDVACYTEFIKSQNETLILKGCSYRSEEECIDIYLDLNSTTCSCQTDFCNSDHGTHYFSPNVYSTHHFIPDHANHLTLDINTTPFTSPNNSTTTHSSLDAYINYHFNPDHADHSSVDINTNPHSSPETDTTIHSSSNIYNSLQFSQDFADQFNLDINTNSQSSLDINKTSNFSLDMSSTYHFSLDMNSTHHFNLDDAAHFSPDISSTYCFSPDIVLVLFFYVVQRIL